MQIITKHKLVVIGVSVIIAACIFFFRQQKENDHPGNKPVYSYTTFYEQSGWGYDILIDNKLFIHQDFIPGLTGKKGFNKKEYAEKTAQLVIQKMQQDKLPTLIKSELEKIGPVNILVYEQPATQ
jgi:Domain of unknown function (DUF4907)